MPVNGDSSDASVSNAVSNVTKSAPLEEVTGFGGVKPLMIQLAFRCFLKCRQLQLYFACLTNGVELFEAPS